MNTKKPPLATDLQPASSSPSDKLGDFHLSVGQFRTQSDGSVLYNSVVRGVVLGDTLHELDDVVSEDESFLASQP